jgi:hypothetical protein
MIGHIVMAAVAAILALVMAADTSTAQSRGSSSTTSRSLPSLPLNLTGPAAPNTTMPTTPPAAIAAPLTVLPGVAPLSPQVTTTPLGSGGPARSDTLGSPTPLSSSPAELAPSTAGGGGRTLKDCMAFWEPATHMTKREWEAACKRTLAVVPEGNH